MFLNVCWYYILLKYRIPVYFNFNFGFFFAAWTLISVLITILLKCTTYFKYVCIKITNKTSHQFTPHCHFESLWVFLITGIALYFDSQYNVPNIRGVHVASPCQKETSRWCQSFNIIIIQIHLINTCINTYKPSNTTVINFTKILKVTFSI